MGHVMKYRWIVETLAETWATTTNTLESASEGDFERGTPCPGWSIRDVLSHLAGFELMIRGESVPAHPGSWPAYVHNPIGEFNEAFVAAYRTKPGREVLALFRGAARQSLEALTSLSEAQWERVGWSPEGDRPYHRFQETRILDSWIHLNDILDALGHRDSDHGSGEEVVLRRFFSTLPYVVAKRARAPEGAVVAVSLTGPGERRGTIELVDGRASFVDTVSSPVTTEVTTSTALFWRRAAGRVGAREVLDDVTTIIRGDRALGERIVEGLVTMI